MAGDPQLWSVGQRARLFFALRWTPSTIGKLSKQHRTDASPHTRTKSTKPLRGSVATKRTLKLMAHVEPRFAADDAAHASRQGVPPETAGGTVEAAEEHGLDAPSEGLSSDEARARLEKSGPNEMPDTAHAAVAHGAREVLGAGAVDARSRGHSRSWFFTSTSKRRSSLGFSSSTPHSVSSRRAARRPRSPL